MEINTTSLKMHRKGELLLVSSSFKAVGGCMNVWDRTECSNVSKLFEKTQNPKLVKILSFFFKTLNNLLIWSFTLFFCSFLFFVFRYFDSAFLDLFHVYMFIGLLTLSVLVVFASCLSFTSHLIPIRLIIFAWIRINALHPSLLDDWALFLISCLVIFL